MGSLVLLGISYSQAASLPDNVLIKPVQVAPHTYFVQGRPEMGSSANQNFISNAGFVVTSGGVVLVDALGSPILAQKLISEIKKITNQKIVAVIHLYQNHR